MVEFYPLSLLVLVLVTSLLFYLTFKLPKESYRPVVQNESDAEKEEELPNRPAEPSITFYKFQKNYLIVYYLAMFADWLKGPYVYDLYSKTYGFDTGTIATLFICGFVSSMVVGTFVGGLADKYGRKNLCLTYSVCYGVAAITKVFPNFYILMFGRFLSGVATSLLFSVFEAWMVCEHIKRGFPSDWMNSTFSYATLGNGIVAVVAGLIAQVVADAFGNIGPFLFSLIPLSSVFFIVSRYWPENYGDSSLDVTSSFLAALNVMRNNIAIVCLGAAQSCFEGGMYAFVFMWNPTLDPEHNKPLNLGLIFAAFMICVMVGSFIFTILTTGRMRTIGNSNEITVLPKVDVTYLPYIVHSVSALSCFFVSQNLQNEHFVYCMFLVFEIMCGIFFPTYGTLRSAIIPESCRSGVMNFFRIPLNLFVVAILTKANTLSLETVYKAFCAVHVLGLVFYALFTRTK